MSRKRRKQFDLSDLVGPMMPAEERSFDKILDTTFISRQRPQPSAEAAPEACGNVDAHTALVDAKTPTPKESGRPQIKEVGAHKSDRHAPGQVRHHLRLPPAISQRFKVFCVEKGLEFQEFVELAGVHYIEDVDAHKASGVDAKTPHDDMMIFKTHEDIIMRYREITGNKWKPRDDREACAYNERDHRLLEIAMIETALRARKRIHSFAYFKDEIDEALDVKLSEETIAVMLERRRRQLAKLQGGAGE